MLLAAIAIGAAMGLVIEAGARGFISTWGSRRLPAWAQLLLVAQGAAIVAASSDTARGFLIVALCWLGALTLGRMVAGVATEIVQASR